MNSPSGPVECDVVRLRAWADDAEKHGKPWVPVSPETLRGIAGAVAMLVTAARRVDAVSRGEDEWDENNVVDAIVQLRAALLPFARNSGG